MVLKRVLWYCKKSSAKPHRSICLSAVVFYWFPTRKQKKQTKQLKGTCKVIKRIKGTVGSTAYKCKLCKKKENRKTLVWGAKPTQDLALFQFNTYPHCRQSGSLTKASSYSTQWKTHTHPVLHLQSACYKCEILPCGTVRRFRPAVLEAPGACGQPVRCNARVAPVSHGLTPRSILSSYLTWLNFPSYSYLCCRWLRNKHIRSKKKKKSSEKTGGALCFPGT